MKHLQHLNITENKDHCDFIIRATGQYYTHEIVATHLILATIEHIKINGTQFETINIIDPFAGDGRLIQWFIELWTLYNLPKVKWDVTLWDLNDNGLRTASAFLLQMRETGLDIKYDCISGDSFKLALDNQKIFDIIITNPPWEQIKPDSRELSSLGKDLSAKYISSLKEYDQFLSYNFPEAQPAKRFAGWGTNLSRVGLDVCRFISKTGGYVGIVMPSSFLADDQTITLRQAMLTQNNLLDVAYFPAEAKLFGSADTTACTMLFKMGEPNCIRPKLTLYNKDHSISSCETVSIPKSLLTESGFVLPISMGSQAIELLSTFTTDFPSFSSLESNFIDGLWAGRELDETGSAGWLTLDGDGPLFLKGRMIDRYSIINNPTHHITKPPSKIPKSVNFERIAWRDVSRPNQRRRLIATIIPAGYATGNSLGVAYFRDDNPSKLRVLLAVMNSLSFEFQLRCHLATGHISLSSLRKVRMPLIADLFQSSELINNVTKALSGDINAEVQVEAMVAKQFYRLTREQYESVLEMFQKLTRDEKEHLLSAFDNINL